ncbi:hypothetical protein BJV74DRAFT_527920 [Russula compacta]|nr:hypothetical protein BJV74DRAFT_527920 [Russula compacta]
MIFSPVIFFSLLLQLSRHSYSGAYRGTHIFERLVSCLSWSGIGLPANGTAPCTMLLRVPRGGSRRVGMSTYCDR